MDSANSVSASCPSDEGGWLEVANGALVELCGDELAPWAERAREIASDPATREVYVITNNHYKGKAVANALMLKSMVSGRRVPAPSAVYETYRDVLEDFAEPDDQFAGSPASLLTARR